MTYEYTQVAALGECVELIEEGPIPSNRRNRRAHYDRRDIYQRVYIALKQETIPQPILFEYKRRREQGKAINIPRLLTLNFEP